MTQANPIEAVSPALVAEHLTKVIGERIIVDDVSFELRRGEVFGFLGPNGAGKTTTIRMLVGLIRPTSGRVTIAAGTCAATSRPRCAASAASSRTPTSTAS